MPRLPDNDTIAEMIKGPRWKIVAALSKPMTAQEISTQVEETPNNVAYHLKHLVKAGVVKAYRHPDSPSRRLYQRQSIFAEILVDFMDEGELVTDLSLLLKATRKPKGYEEVAHDG